MHTPIFEQLRAVDEQIDANSTPNDAAIDYQNLSEQLENIHTKRLTFRPVATCDAWPLFEATRNPLFNQHLLWEPPSDEAPVLERIGAIANSSRRGKLAAVSAVLKTTGEWMSLFRFQPYNADPSLIEIGLWTHPEFWRGGFSFELLKACVDAAFLLSNTGAVMAVTTHGNKAAQRLMTMIGMAHTRLVTRKTELQEDLELQEFCITRGEWLQRTRSASFTQVPMQVVPLARTKPMAPSASLAALKVEPQENDFATSTMHSTQVRQPPQTSLDA